jgi:hypothetical protein
MRKGYNRIFTTHTHPDKNAGTTHLKQEMGSMADPWTAHQTTKDAIHPDDSREMFEIRRSILRKLSLRLRKESENT